MKVFSTNNKLLVFISLFLTICCVIEEGNIFIPMTSNFTLEHSESKINNKNYYTIPLLVGTPEEEYNVQVDTSSATTWIPSSHCENCVLAHRLYEEEDSRTSSPTDIHIEIKDEDGNVEGRQISDNIKLGDYKLKQFGFVQVTKVADDFRDHYQGKLGLGYKNHHLKDEEYNFLEKLKKHNLIKKKIFSINAINEKKGMLFIGDTPGKEYNSYCNVTDTDELDDMYKESWVCQLTHVGMFDKEKGIFNKIKYYNELKNNKLVSFDSGYDYIAVPISEKENIDKLLDKAELDCKERKKREPTKSSEDTLRNRIREEEITITCKASMKDINEKDLILSFVLEGYAYSLPFESLFVEGSNKDEVEMLVKYIDDEDAIWTFGYPFMNQFLMIFNMEDNHVGIKKLKKTALPIININNKDWQKYTLKEESSSTSIFKIIGYITLALVAIAIIFFIIHAIRKRNPDSNKIEVNNKVVY
jgi:hypothetical protein